MLSKKVVKEYQELLRGAQIHQPLNHIDTNAQLTHARDAYPAGEGATCHHLDQFIADDIGDNKDINRWISELAWRDFYRHVLVDKPKLIYHQAYKNELDSSINWSYSQSTSKML